MPATVATVIGAVGIDAGTAATIASVVTPALEGAGVGGLVGDVTGGGKGLTKGLELGALTGGGVGLGGALGGSLLPGGVAGVSGATVGDILGGAAGGSIGGEATGGNVGLSALEGAGSGLISSQLSGSGANSSTGAPSTTPSAGTAGGGAASAGGTAAPASIAGGTSPDVSSQFGQQAFDQAQGTNLASVAQNPGPPAVSPTGGIGAGGASNVSDTASALPTSSTPSTPIGSTNSAPATANVGTGTVGTQGLPDVTPAGLGAGSLGASYDPSAGISSGATGGIQSPSNVSPPPDAPGFLSSAIKSLEKNALPVTIAGSGLIMDAIKNQQAIKGENEIKSIAANEMSQGKTLQNYLQTGTLPPGLQAGLDQASSAAAASIRSQYAARGMSGSSAEAQDLANLQATVESQGSQMALNLLQTGINETGMASSLYESLINETLGKDQQLGSAISSFASAAAGGGGNRVIQVSG